MDAALQVTCSVSLIPGFPLPLPAVAFTSFCRALQGTDFLPPVFAFESTKTYKGPQDWEKLLPEPLLVS